MKLLEISLYLSAGLVTVDVILYDQQTTFLPPPWGEILPNNGDYTEESRTERKRKTWSEILEPTAPEGNLPQGFSCVSQDIHTVSTVSLVWVYCHLQLRDKIPLHCVALDRPNPLHLLSLSGLSCGIAEPWFCPLLWPACSSTALHRASEEHGLGVWGCWVEPGL